MPWKYRQVQIEDDLAVADSGTKTIDIDVRDPITALIIRFKVKNGASDVDETPPENCITHIELVDGGTVYWSLPGPQAVAASVYGLGRWPRQWYDERAANNQRIMPTLMFGRYLGDEQYAFTPTRLTNPQLKITWTDVATYADGYYTIGVTAQVMEGLAPPPSILAWKEIEAWTTASGVHRVELPRDYVYRALMMRAYLADYAWNDLWTNFKLDCDVGKFIPFDLNYHEFGDILRQEFGPYSVEQFLSLTDGDRKTTWLGETIHADGANVGSGYIVDLYTGGAWPHFLGYILTHAGVPATDRPVQALVTGFYPHTCLLWPFGRWMEPGTWMDPRPYGSVDLKITEATASGAGSVALQQVRPLP